MGNTEWANVRKHTKQIDTAEQVTTKEENIKWMQGTLKLDGLQMECLYIKYMNLHIAEFSLTDLGYMPGLFHMFAFISQILWAMLKIFPGEKWM